MAGDDESGGQVTLCDSALPRLSHDGASGTRRIAGDGGEGMVPRPLPLAKVLSAADSFTAAYH